MAGYLGTLFMGGVGIRLILPPATEFNKLTSRLQKGLSNAQTVGENIANRFAQRRKKKLEADLNQADSLIASLETTANAKKMTRLKNLLQHIEKEHNVSMQRALRRLRNLEKGFGKDGFGGSKQGQGAQADLDAARAFQPQATGRMKEFEETLAMAAGAMGLIISRTIRWSKILLGTWANAMRTSVMWFITFGYQMSIMLKGFMDFERELINANSIFQTTRENLYAMSDELIKFGYKFGINYGDASKVLYQFASAGLTAEESMVALKDTLTLTMAVQGDFNTLGKLMVQVIKGFGLEMEDTAEIADKFAYTINKSLIEWKDLSAAVKFAMPFFVAAGQSIDQLLGSLQILTDRALEAGIAGRGLRQAIAQFVEHADDNNAAFRKLGVEILDAEGNMRALTDIALQFEAAMGEDVSQMDIMMTLMQDLNIRGATAFVHLAQNATEFKLAVDDLVNSQGAANEMAEYQQASLTNQVQLLKNAIFSVFYLSDATYAGTGAINGFDYALKQIVETIKSKFTVELADGSFVLTDFGYALRDVVIKAVYALGDVLLNIVDIVYNLSTAGRGLFDMMTVLFSAIKLVTDTLANMDPSTVKLIAQVWLLNNLFGTGAGLVIGFGLALVKLGDWMNGILPGAERLAHFIAVIAGALGGGVLGLITGFASGALTGGLVAAGAAGGTALLTGAIMGSWAGGLPGAAAGAIMSIPVAAGAASAAFWGGAATGGAIGAGVGGAAGVAGGAYGGHKLYQAASALEGGVYNQSAAGTSIPALSSYSTELDMLSVNNLYTANDDLGYRAENSTAITGW